MDRQEELETRLQLCKLSLAQHVKRGRAAEAAVQAAAADTAAGELRSLLSSDEYRSAMARARALLSHLPELALRFPALDPIQLQGTSAQGLQVREMAEYSDVTEVAGAGRHQMLRARRPVGLGDSAGLSESAGTAAAAAAVADGDCTSSDGEWVVLKGFESSELRALRRELNALSRLRHANIVPLRGVVRQQEPLRWFLELPEYPRNLRAWLGQWSGAGGGGGVVESVEDRDARVGAMMAGVLAGLAYLHEVGTSSWGLSA
jgi:hypothetical protein